mmetsp:Transcript_12024/g.34385  ORF Transcript_12024/g.34385 Transcript_12024/m.34385 type:complete len:105 (+) Transcript_12024:189-503(+)
MQQGSGAGGYWTGAESNAHEESLQQQLEEIQATAGIHSAGHSMERFLQRLHQRHGAGFKTIRSAFGLDADSTSDIDRWALLPLYLETSWLYEGRSSRGDPLCIS